ncbi:heptaprenyl diphosphate synthase component II [Ornithinibacillus sp. BX22]|uniref:Heptaprenyl diphosphate synthase component 2 n=2 Tax=Ornithinibacillus TaxID=484508 RepID=A0A923RIC2_9BACI|nr:MULTISPECIES: heptaprenyl diphosphate synthase component II [Ornithinibacillus]MBC5637071.1 heptaprenyl diphosphate synthase component II [Ornithinibacillus hominis]MBS3679718.1 heptaprenyl diphosphate synthase component II [Ornithinibacillus massiliensis]
MKLPKTYTYLKKDLDVIESSLMEAIQANHPVLREASTQLLKAGGKRIRPVFVLLSSQFGTVSIEQITKVAVSLELIHMATLVHDDVIDDAELRRGMPTIKKQYGNRVAMYTGDYILARALETITQIDNAELHKTLAEALVEVSLGEIQQIKDKYNWDQNIRSYLRRIKRKTALLLALSCKLGAMTSGITPSEVKKLYEYGYYIGMSYQIIDDILDFTSSAEELGKPSGNDLYQGNVTLPVLYAMRDENFNRLVRETFANPDEVSKEKMECIISRLKETDAIDMSYQLSERYLKKAFRALNGFPHNKAKITLEQIAKYIGKRKQ